jgi:hypothetical protein
MPASIHILPLVLKAHFSEMACAHEVPWQPTSFTVVEII